MAQKSRRPTPAQDAIVAYVAENPGCSPKAAIEAIWGTPRTWMAGYNAIHRARRAGRLRLEKVARGFGWRCYPTGA